MSDKHEPIASVLAEMREAAKSTDLFNGEEVGEPLIRGTKVEEWADRIGAAAKREREETKDYFAKLHDGPSMICTAKNCSLRNAAEDIVEQVKAEASFGHFAPAVVEDRPVGNAAATRKFDEAAFDAAVSKPNGWSDVADPVAEIRRMRDGDDPGNAAELREALIYVRDLMRRVRDGDRISSLAFLGVVEHALAAPARNVDRFATKDEARRAYWAYREPLEFNNKPFVAITEWLFAPAEGGDHA